MCNGFELLYDETEYSYIFEWRKNHQHFGSLFFIKSGYDYVTMYAESNLEGKKLTQWALPICTKWIFGNTKFSSIKGTTLRFAMLHVVEKLGWTITHKPNDIACTSGVYFCNSNRDYYDIKTPDEFSFELMK